MISLKGRLSRQHIHVCNDNKQTTVFRSGWKLSVYQPDWRGTQVGHPEHWGPWWITSSPGPPGPFDGRQRPIAAKCVEARIVRGTGAASFTAADGKKCLPKSDCRMFDAVRCRLMAYCCITFRLNDMRLASRCSWSAACSDCSLAETLCRWQIEQAGNQSINLFRNMYMQT